MTDQEIRLECYRQAGNLHEAKTLYEWVIKGEEVLTGISGSTFTFKEPKPDEFERWFLLSTRANAGLDSSWKFSWGRAVEASRAAWDAGVDFAIKSRAAKNG